AGWSLRLIGKDIKCSHSVVKYAVETDTYKRHQGRGRKRKLTEADVRHLKILSARDRRKTTADLQPEMNASRSESENVSRMTISRRLMEQGLKGRIAATKPLLRPVNIQTCPRFSSEHGLYTGLLSLSLSPISRPSAVNNTRKSTTSQIFAAFDKQRLGLEWLSSIDYLDMEVYCFNNS
uniref:Transposase Tc1-like domain-containing protein n=1 Tax=Stegastes partitus TaxID=144197 RepID=A0A3B5A8L7_9TELE